MVWFDDVCEDGFINTPSYENSSRVCRKLQTSTNLEFVSLHVNYVEENLTSLFDFFCCLQDGDGVPREEDGNGSG
jgi:hypothetical protein